MSTNQAISGGRATSSQDGTHGRGMGTAILFGLLLGAVALVLSSGVALATDRDYPEVLICFSAMLICTAGPILRICASALIEER